MKPLVFGPIVLDGKLDVVIEWRRKNWICRAWGITFGQWFFGLITFKKVEPAVEPGSYKKARGVLKGHDK